MQSNAAVAPAVNAMCPLEQLICGSATATSTAIEDESILVLKGISKLITSYYDFSLEYKQDLSRLQSSYFLPVSLRSLMETTAIGLLARIDPLRVLLSSKSQNSAAYNKAMPQAAALKWKGDVMGEAEKASATPATSTAAAATKSLWDPGMSSSKLPRHLFSGQMCEAFWEPAAKNLANLPNTISSTWLAELQSETPKDLIKKLIGEGNQIYSELSKGIHPEFAVKRESEYDSPTLQTYLERAFKWTSSLGLLSHCSASFSTRLQFDLSLNHLKTIEEIAR